MRVTISEVMNPAPVTIRAAQSVRAAAKLMHTHHDDYLLVVDGETLVGVVTARDLVERIFALNGSGDMRVELACTMDLFTAAPEDKLALVLDAMRDRGLSRVPVVRDGKLAGIFAIDDLGATVNREAVDIFSRDDILPEIPTTGPLPTTTE